MQSGVLVLVYALIFWTMYLLATAAGKDDCRMMKYIPPIREKALMGHVIKNLSSETPDFCEIACYWESDCVSYNLGPLKDGKYVCELSDSDSTTHDGDLVPREGFIYRGTENACSNNICPAKQKCQNGFTDKKYRCKCRDDHTNGPRGLNLSSILGSLDQEKYLEQILSYLNPVLVDSVRSRFVRCYRAETDGWAASEFHSNCDEKGPTVTIIKVNSYIFGAYINKAWDDSCLEYAASKAFIFSLYNSRGYSPVKLTQYQNQQQAIYSCPSQSLTIGSGNDIFISDNANSNAGSYVNIGGTFLPPSGCSFGDSCSRNFLAGTYYFTPTDVEVFYETTQC